MLGPTLLSLHNVAFYCRLMAEIREAIGNRTFARFHEVSLVRWKGKF
jgi:queuine tRNA-ribosyltransferase